MNFEVFFPLLSPMYFQTSLMMMKNNLELLMRTNLVIYVGDFALFEVLVGSDPLEVSVVAVFDVVAVEV